MDDLLIPINDYHSNLQREIDEAEWMGDFYQADFIKRELEHGTRHTNIFTCLDSLHRWLHLLLS